MDWVVWLDANHSDALWHREDLQRRQGNKDAVLCAAQRGTLHPVAGQRLAQPARPEIGACRNRVGRNFAGLPKPRVPGKSDAHRELSIHDIGSRSRAMSLGSNLTSPPPYTRPLWTSTAWFK